MNILANAIDALQEVKDKTECCSLSPIITIETQKLDSQQIQVTISDNGPGIPPDIQGKLFDPFFTTKPVGQGTGLGLSICYQIVEKHKGKIEVISQLGQGTKFVLLLAAH
jgi:signal transduction histidine kinase